MIARLLARVPIAVAIGFCVAFVALPLLAMLRETVVTPEGIGFDAWRQILTDPLDRVRMLRSLQLAGATTLIALVLGGGHAWATERTDLWAARWLGPLGAAPLAIPPILVAMGFADLGDMTGFWGCAFLLGVSFAPFVAVLTARGLRATDGRSYEAALLARGSRRADLLLLRTVAPEIAAGCLFAFVFALSEHGVPEFLTVKGKTWHTYAEGIFARWTRRATGVDHDDLVGPIVASVPLVAVIALALAVALRLRAKATVRDDFRALPQRRLGWLRVPGLALVAVYLGSGIGVPVTVMALWAAGSTDLNAPTSLATLITSLRTAVAEAGGDLAYTVGIGLATTALLLVVAVPLARCAARRWPAIDAWSVLPLAVPGIVLAIGCVHVYNSRIAAEVYTVTGDFYDSWAIVVAAYAARFLPFGVLTLSHAVRRIPTSIEEAAALARRGPLARALGIHLPLMLPAAWSAACLVFILALRELDVAVVLPAGNGTVVRRLSNIVHFGGEDMGGALALLLLLAATIIPLVTVLITGRRLRPLS